MLLEEAVRKVLHDPSSLPASAQEPPQLQHTAARPSSGRAGSSRPGSAKASSTRRAQQLERERQAQQHLDLLEQLEAVAAEEQHLKPGHVYHIASVDGRSQSRPLLGKPHWHFGTHVLGGGCDFFLPGVSHCKFHSKLVVYEDCRLSIMPLHSTKRVAPVLVNGSELEKHEQRLLRMGDEVSIAGRFTVGQLPLEEARVQAQAAATAAELRAKHAAEAVAAQISPANVVGKAHWYSDKLTVRGMVPWRHRARNASGGGLERPR